MPSPAEPNDVTRMLRDARDGDSGAREQLFTRVYGELKRLAAGQLRNQRAGASWQPTALVNEAFLRMVDPADLDVGDRSHFFSVAVTVMRRVLVDHYRRKQAKKRGGGGAHVTLHDPADADSGGDSVDLIALDEALQGLAVMDERKARVVELRFFGGLSVDEVATVLGVSRRTVESDWFFARAWLQSRIDGAGS